MLQVNLRGIRAYLNEELNCFENFKVTSEYNWCKNIEMCLNSALTTLDAQYKKYFCIGKYLGYFDRLLNFSGDTDQVLPKSKLEEFMQLIHSLELNKQDENYIGNQVLYLSDKAQDFAEISRNIQIPCIILDYLQYRV